MIWGGDAAWEEGNPKRCLSALVNRETNCPLIGREEKPFAPLCPTIAGRFRVWLPPVRSLFFLGGERSALPGWKAVRRLPGTAVFG